MFDYKLLSALAAVVEQAGFERGAQVLGLSQSAISPTHQAIGGARRPAGVDTRLAADAHRYRPAPAQPRAAGAFAERDLQSQVPALDEEGMPERLRIALNADSLATCGPRQSATSAPNSICCWT